MTAALSPTAFMDYHCLFPHLTVRLEALSIVDVDSVVAMSSSPVKRMQWYALRRGGFRGFGLTGSQSTLAKNGLNLLVHTLKTSLREALHGEERLDMTICRHIEMQLNNCQGIRIYNAIVSLQPVLLLVKKRTTWQHRASGPRIIGPPDS